MGPTCSQVFQRHCGDLSAWGQLDLYPFVQQAEGGKRTHHQFWPCPRPIITCKTGTRRPPKTVDHICGVER